MQQPAAARRRLSAPCLENSAFGLNFAPSRSASRANGAKKDHLAAETGARKLVVRGTEAVILSAVAN
jgi:hypothetical protein